MRRLDAVAALRVEDDFFAGFYFGGHESETGPAVVQSVEVEQPLQFGTKSFVIVQTQAMRHGDARMEEPRASEHPRVRDTERAIEPAAERAPIIVERPTGAHSRFVPELLQPRQPLIAGIAHD